MSRLNASLTVGLWGLLNTALFLLLVGFGEWVAAIALYAGSVVLVFVLALAVRGAGRRRSERAWRSPRNGDSVLILASSILLAGLAWVFYWQLVPVAALPLLLALRREITTRHRSS